MTTLTFLRLWFTYIGATLRNSRMIWMMAIQNGGMCSNMRQHEGNTESCDTATTDASLLVFDKFVVVLHRWIGLQQILFGFVLWAPHPIMNRIIRFTHSMTMIVVNPNLAFGDGWCNPEKWLVGGFNPSEKYESQLGWSFPNFPIYGKIKNVPNHQPELLNNIGV